MTVCVQVPSPWVSKKDVVREDEDDIDRVFYVYGPDGKRLPEMVDNLGMHAPATHDHCSHCFLSTHITAPAASFDLVCLLLECRHADIQNVCRLTQAFEHCLLYFSCHDSCASLSCSGVQTRGVFSSSYFIQICTKTLGLCLVCFHLDMCEVKPSCSVTLTCPQTCVCFLCARM